MTLGRGVRADRSAGRVRLAMLALLMVVGAMLGAGGSAALASSVSPPASSGSSVDLSRRVPFPRPKVAIIVGPVGEYTADYKAYAAQAVAAAKRHNATIVTVYTPNATWPKVRDALQGASVVVYLGHGNGFPSPYRSERWPFSENGFGVNVTGDRNNEDHQYFGEYYLRREVRLAPNALVILSHLCYASGNSEPGMPEDGRDVAVQRVDNYAAGFIAAGAAAVIADGRLSPAYYVDSVLGRQSSIFDIWRHAPTFNDHVSSFMSRRSHGFTGYVDPDTRNAGYYHSLVVWGRTRATDVLAGAGRMAIGAGYLPPLKLFRKGRGTRPATIGALQVQRAPVAGKPLAVTLPITGRHKSLPKSGMQLGVRWDPIDVSDAPTSDGAQSTDGSSDGSSTQPAGNGDSGAAGNGDSGAAGTGDAGKQSTGTAADRGNAKADGQPPDPNTMWIAPEQPGNVVETEIAKVTAERITAKLMVPSRPGLYRLTITLSSSDGLDLPPWVVKQPASYLVTVPSRIGVGVQVPGQLRTVIGRPAALNVTVTNTGSAPWMAPGPDAKNLQLSAWFVPAAQVAGTPTPRQSSPIANLAPGASAHLTLKLQTPTVAGDYLLVLEITRGDGTLLDPDGSNARVIHVTVVVQPPTSGTDNGNAKPTPDPSDGPVSSPKPAPASRGDL